MRARVQRAGGPERGSAQRTAPSGSRTVRLGPNEPAPADKVSLCLEHRVASVATEPRPSPHHSQTLLRPCIKRQMAEGLQHLVVVKRIVHLGCWRPWLVLLGRFPIPRALDFKAQLTNP